MVQVTVSSRAESTTRPDFLRPTGDSSASRDHCTMLQRFASAVFVELVRNSVHSETLGAIQ